MAYEKINLVVAGISGDIYMARVLKEGTMSDSRRKVTEECLVATTEWFMRNNKKMIQYGKQNNGTAPTLFYTGDSDKAKRILGILEND